MPDALSRAYEDVEDADEDNYKNEVAVSSIKTEKIFDKWYL